MRRQPKDSRSPFGQCWQCSTGLRTFTGRAAHFFTLANGLIRPPLFTRLRHCHFDIWHFHKITHRLDFVVENGMEMSSGEERKEAYWARRERYDCAEALASVTPTRNVARTMVVEVGPEARVKPTE